MKRMSEPYRATIAFEQVGDERADIVIGLWRQRRPAAGGIAPA